MTLPLSVAALSFAAWVYLTILHGRFWCGDQRLEGSDAPPAVWPHIIAVVGLLIGMMEPEEMEHLLSDTVLGDFQARLGRIGVEYQTPSRP
ncbi:MAG: hypothetical protein ABGY42_15585 [bacterium]